jgi:sensor histidine kinase YesM
MTSVMVLYYTSYYYLMMVTEREMRLMALATSKEAEIKMLRYQLNPHFMINTMNAISTLILKQDNKTAMGMVDKLSDFLSYSLDSSPEDKVELHSEIAHLEQFVGIEKTRFSDRLSYQSVIDEEVSRAVIPSMLLQPLVENAIKYAINPREDGGTIFVQAYKDAGKLHIIVSDDGPGLQSDDDTVPHGRGVGLRNTQDRLKAIYGDHYSLKLRDNVPTGFIVSIIIPCEILRPESP